MDDIVVFDDKKLSDVLKDIHDNTLYKRKSIESVISQLVGMMSSPDDVQLILPYIKDFYDVSVKNDEHMVKVATIAQRLASSTSSNNDFILSDDEKQELLNGYKEEIKKIPAIIDEKNSK